MQIVFVGLGLLALAAVSFVAVMVLSRVAFRKWDERKVTKLARSVEAREANLRKFSMADLHGTTERKI